MTQLRFYDTMRKAADPFTPLGDVVGMYSCGPTVYHDAHLGNLRTYVFVDMAKKVLRHCGYPVKHVMNITDVGHLVSDSDEGEDKMEVGARREGLTAWDIALRYEAGFIQQCLALNIAAPDILSRATAHIPQQIAMISTLEEKGLTYRTGDGIYFDTAQLEDYGKLTGASRDGFEAGARVDAGDKRNPTDFALWKFSGDGEQRQMEWDSPWGTGFPGWHIECSAMARQYLGDQIDIHTGGIDHIAIHHSNEIAQTECCTGKPFAHTWMHGAFLEATDGVKMAKSSGEFLTVFTLQEREIDPLAFRLLCFRTHYRKRMLFSWKHVEDAATALRRLRLRVKTLSDEAEALPPTSDAAQRHVTRIEAALRDDLAMPQVMVELQTILKSKALEPGEKLGLLAQYDPLLGLELRREIDGPLPQDLARAAWEEATRAGGSDPASL